MAAPKAPSANPLTAVPPLPNNGEKWAMDPCSAMNRPSRMSPPSAATLMKVNRLVTLPLHRTPTTLIIIRINTHAEAITAWAPSLRMMPWPPASAVMNVDRAGEVIGEYVGDGGDGNRPHEPEGGPAVDEGDPAPAVGFADVDVLTAGLGQHGAEFGDAESAAKGEETADQPDEQAHARRAHVGGDGARRLEDAGTDHAAHDDGGGFEGTEPPNETFVFGIGNQCQRRNSNRFQPILTSTEMPVKSGIIMCNTSLFAGQ